MRASLFLRPTFFALILLSTVLCMDDALDEADEIYQIVHEGFTLQDEEFLMDLFSEDKLSNNVATGTNSIDSEVKDPQKGNNNQLTALDAKLDINKKRQLIGDHFRNQLQMDRNPKYRIPWDRLDTDDFVNWPKTLAIKPLQKYKKKDLALLLSQLENIRWSERFLQRNTFKKHVSDYHSNYFKKKKSGKYHFRRKLVYNHFQKLLRLNNLNQKKIEWAKLRKSDFINWPDNLEIKAPIKYNATEFSILLSNLEKISFNTDYIQNLLAIKHLAVQDMKYNRNHICDTLSRKLIIKHFKNLLKLNNLTNRMNWSKLKKEDLINWPENLPIQPPKEYNKQQLKGLIPVLHQIRFSELFLKKSLGLSY